MDLDVSAATSSVRELDIVRRGAAVLARIAQEALHREIPDRGQSVTNLATASRADLGRLAGTDRFDTTYTRSIARRGEITK